MNMDKTTFVDVLVVVLGTLIAVHLSQSVFDLVATVAVTSAAFWLTARKARYLSTKFLGLRQLIVAFALIAAAALYLIGIPLMTPFYHAGVSVLVSIFAGTVVAFILEPSTTKWL
jgi:hypothetical protein